MLWAGVDPEIRRAAKGYSLRYDVAAGKPVGWGGHQTHRPSIIELVDKLLYKIFGQLPQTDPADQQANQDDPSSDSTRKPRGGQPRIGATARFSMPTVYDPDYDPDWGYPESKQLTFKEFFTEADGLSATQGGMSRRDFLGKLGKGASMAARVVNLPWMKLFSAPELATKVAAPFLMGANKVINPLQMYQVFLKRITSQWNDQGVAFDNQPPYKSPLVGVHVHTIPDFVVQYVAKNMLEYTADNFEYTDDADQHFLTDILDELDKGKQHVLDDPWVPQYIKDDVAANYHEEEEGVPSGDIEDLNFDNIVGALYLSPEKANNWELLDHNIEDSLLRALGSSRDNWTRAYEEGEGSPLLSSILDYIEDLILPRAKFDWDPTGEERQMSAEDVVKMDFKSQIIPGTVNWLRAMKVQSLIDTQTFDQDAAKHRADKETDARNKDYLNRRPAFPELPDHGREWESKKIKTDADLIFEAYSEADMSRRDFLGKLGKGVSLAANIPWTKLISAPKLAAAVTAPFKIGAGTMLNPQALHWYYVRKFYNKALDSGLTPVDVTDERHYEYDHTEISTEAFEWVAKNVINMYVDDVDHSTDREGNTVAPTLSELINHMGEEKEHFIDDPNFPEWAKPLLAKDEEDMTDEEEERYQNLMNSKWFDKQMVINWDGEWGHGADEEVEELLGNWMRWHPDKSPVGDGESELIDTVFDYIIHLNDKRMDINEIMKMDFKQEFLPGVVKYANAMAVNPGGNIEYEPDAQRAADVDTSAGGLERQRRPGQERSEQEYWDDRFHAFSDEELVDEYKDFAQMILNNSDNPRFSDPKLQKEAQMFLDELEHRYPPEDVPSKHPYGVGRPQSGLQTASTKPTFKAFFTEAGSDRPSRFIKPSKAKSARVGLGHPNSGRPTGKASPGSGSALPPAVTRQILRDPVQLKYYHDKHPAVGREIGTSHKTVAVWFRVHGLPITPVGQHPRATASNKPTAAGQRARTITGPGNVGTHQTQLPTPGGIPGKVNTKMQGPRRGKGH